VNWREVAERFYVVTSCLQKNILDESVRRSTISTVMMNDACRGSYPGCQASTREHIQRCRNECLEVNLLRSIRSFRNTTNEAIGCAAYVSSIRTGMKVLGWERKSALLSESVGHCGARDRSRREMRARIPPGTGHRLNRCGCSRGEWLNHTRVVHDGRTTVRNAEISEHSEQISPGDVAVVRSPAYLTKWTISFGTPFFADLLRRGCSVPRFSVPV
jgi:hypothetical protein